MAGDRDEQRADQWEHVTLRWRQILPEPATPAGPRRSSGAISA